MKMDEIGSFEIELQ